METKILITENDPLLGQLYLGFLSTVPNIQIDLAISPKNCREYLDKTHYDLLFMDIDLGDPEEDGIDMLHSLKNHYTEVPIIMMSSRDDDRTINECLELGADCFLPKSTGFILEMVQKVKDFGRGRELQPLCLSAG